MLLIMSWIDFGLRTAICCMKRGLIFIRLYAGFLWHMRLILTVYRLILQQ